MFLPQRLLTTQRGREGHSSEGAEGMWEWSSLSRAAEDGAVRPGLPPQWADKRRTQACGGGLLSWDALPPHLHLHTGCWDQPTSPQVSECFSVNWSFLPQRCLLGSAAWILPDRGLGLRLVANAAWKVPLRATYTIKLLAAVHRSEVVPQLSRWYLMKVSFSS